MENSTGKRREELEKYFDAKGPFAYLRVAQMKRAWKQKKPPRINLVGKYIYSNSCFRNIHYFNAFFP